MRFLIIGDTHGYMCLLKIARKLAWKKKVDAIIVCGDFGWWPRWTNPEWKSDREAMQFCKLVKEQIPCYNLVI